MADAGQSPAKTESAEQFVTSIFKFSVVTFVSMGFYLVYFVVTNFFVSKDVLGQVTLFTDFTNTFMTIGILGLDQALMRFYHEPPAGTNKNSLFRHCIYFSLSVIVVAALVCSTLFSGVLYNAIGFEDIGRWVIPLLFLTAAFYMISRYFNVLYRLEMNARTYTIQGVLLQFFYKLFFFVGVVFQNPTQAMVICSALGFGVFAVAQVIIRRKALRPKPIKPNGGVYRAVLPFGLAVAPTAVFVTLTAGVPKSIISNLMGSTAIGIYAFAYQMSSVVTMVQGGFAAYWAPYMYKNYKTQQPRILRVHEYINFIILAFFSVLVIFEDILFWVFGNYYVSMQIFPLLMMSAVFNILTETTVHGNAIARRPVFDTIGIILGALTNFGACFLLIPHFGLVGAAAAIVVGNGVSFLFRTLTAQRLYKSIPYVGKTVVAILTALVLAMAGTVFWQRVFVKAAFGVATMVVYCLLYRTEFKRCVQIGLSLVKGII
jgi:O-antigen/teichoic acid export membrane protein